MRILAVCGANGSWLYPLSKWLIGNYEPRSIFHTPKEIQWKCNFLGIPIWNKKNYDIRDVGNVDVIVGAPNCGHSSILALSNSKFRDARDDESFKIFFLEIQRHKPTLFVMENLPKAKENAIELANEMGYMVINHTISMSQLGNSQVNRKRYILIGVNKDVPNAKNILLTMSKLKRMSKLKSSGELIGDLAKGTPLNPEIGHVREGIDDMITIYGGKKITLREAKHYWKIHPNAKRFEAKDRKYSQAPGVYRNLKYDYPAVARKADRQFNHLGYQMSPRELARIQGIPDDFKIYFPKDILNDKDRNYWINKGRVTATKCPPYEFGAWILDRIEALLASDFYKKKKIP